MTKPSYMELYAAQNACCFYCGKAMGPSRSNAPQHLGWTIDHFIPKCRGGHSLNNNVVLCHSRCNIIKGGRLPSSQEAKKFHALYKKIRFRRQRITTMEREARINAYP